MLTDVLCLCFGMIISKLIEKPYLLSQFKNNFKIHVEI